MNWEIVRNINSAARENNSMVYYVGGCVRDILLRRDIEDIDLLVYRGKDFIDKLRKKINAVLICLDEERDIFRLVLRASKNTVDVSFEKEETPLMENLRKRDFTINAMAIKYEDIHKDKRSYLDVVIDHFSGKEDIEKGIIRMVRAENLIDDPLRLCRAFRLSAQLGYSIDEETLVTIKKKSQLLIAVSPERIHDEWVKLLLNPYSANYVKKMMECSLFSVIFPEAKEMENLDQGERHLFPLWEHSLATLSQLEKMLIDGCSYRTLRLSMLISRIIGEYKDKLLCLKMAALFHDIGKPLVKGSGKRGQVTFYNHEEKGEELLRKRMKALRFSASDIKITSKLVLDHMLPFLLSQSRSLSQKAIAKLYIRLGNVWPMLLLLSLADVESTRSDRGEIDAYAQFIDTLSTSMEAIERKDEMTPFVTGNVLRDELRFPSGPLMGKALKMIRMGYLSGTIKSKKEALAMARNILTQTNASPTF